jgi:hypothetical protein
MVYQIKQYFEKKSELTEMPNNSLGDHSNDSKTHRIVHPSLLPSTLRPPNIIDAEKLGLTEPIQVQPVYYLPFTVNKYEYTPQPEPYGLRMLIDMPVPCQIDPGHIPPNYVHTWAIDVRCTEPTDDNPDPADTFTLGFDDAELDWDGNGDTFTILNVNGEVIETFISLRDLVLKEFTIQRTTYDPKPSPGDLLPFKRLYLILETSEKIMERRMILRWLVTRKQPPATAEVRMVEDDINYDTKEPFIDAQDANGNPIYPPWSAMAPTSGRTAEGAPMRFDKALRSDGWYLLGENITDTTPGFFAIVYYNEYESKLRAYLFNRDITGDATGFLVQFSLLCKGSDGQYKYLSGAIFPANPNPWGWANAIGTIPLWHKGTWIMLETPMLYPMGSNFPVRNPGNVLSGYHSLYEEPLNTKNVLLQIKIAPYLEGILRGNIIAEAVGQAIEKLTDKTTADILKGIGEGIKNGIDFYKGASDLANGIKDALIENKDNWGQNLMSAAALASASVSAMGPWLAVAAAAVSMVTTFITQKEPLTMTITLALQGKFTGEVFIDLQPSIWEFYLPGRFSIKEAFEQDQVPNSSRRYIDSLIPRYDRPLGLFGYQVNTQDYLYAWILRYDYRYSTPRYGYPECQFSIPRCVPSGLVKVWDSIPSQLSVKPWELVPQLPVKPCKEYFIDRFLPIIYNRFANIRPLPTPFSRMYCKAFFEGGEKLDDFMRNEVVTMGEYYQPKVTTVTVYDPARGFELEILGVYLPGVYQTDWQPPDRQLFKVVSTIWKHDFVGQESVWTTPDVLPYLGPTDYQMIVDEIYTFTTRKGQEQTPDHWGPGNDFDYEYLSPLHDIIYYWNVRYYIYDRNGSLIGGETAKLSAPIPIRIERVVWEYLDNYGPAGEFDHIDYTSSGNDIYPPTSSMLARMPPSR